MTLHLSSTLFGGTPITTLQVGGRPAWLARQVAVAIGCEPTRFVSRLVTEWADTVVLGRDYTVVVGEELATILKVAPDAVAEDAAGAVVLFESGIVAALERTQPECGPKLRDHLSAQVPAEPRVATELDLRIARERRLAGVLDFHDRRLRHGALRTTAAELHAGGFIDRRTYGVLIVRACEIALGTVLSELDPRDDWSTVAQIATRTGAPEHLVLATAGGMRLLTPRPGEVRAFPVHNGTRWHVSFAFAPSVAAQVQAMVANRVADRASLKAA